MNATEPRTKPTNFLEIHAGKAVPISRLVYDTEHSLIDQSLSARSRVQTTNGDGFGVGWYDHHDSPGLYRNLRPAWNDPNLLDLCEHVQSHLFLAHVRAATSTPVQQTNCHPSQRSQPYRPEPDRKD